MNRWTWHAHDYLRPKYILVVDTSASWRNARARLAVLVNHLSIHHNGSLVSANHRLIERKIVSYYVEFCKCGNSNTKYRRVSCWSSRSKFSTSFCVLSSSAEKMVRQYLYPHTILKSLLIQSMVFWRWNMENWIFLTQFKILWLKLELMPRLRT